MAKLLWDQQGEHVFHAGVDRGVLFKYNKVQKKYDNGVAWSGLTAVNENPSGADSNKYYADNQLYLNITSAEQYGATIEAYTFPEEFDSCNGYTEIADGVSIGQQDRDTFAFAYRSKVGNDMDQDAGYIIHVVYGCKAAPSSKSHATIGENVEPGTFSWEISTTPINVEGYKPTATVDIDSTKTDATKLAAFEDKLYGTASTESELLMPLEIATLLGRQAVTVNTGAGSGSTNGGGTNLG